MVKKLGYIAASFIICCIMLALDIAPIWNFVFTILAFLICFVLGLAVATICLGYHIVQLFCAAAENDKLADIGNKDGKGYMYKDGVLDGIDIVSVSVLPKQASELVEDYKNKKLLL